MDFSFSCYLIEFANGDATWWSLKCQTFDKYLYILFCFIKIEKGSSDSQLIQPKDDKQAARDISHFEKRFSSFHTNWLTPIQVQELKNFYDDHVDADNVPSLYDNKDYNQIKGSRNNYVFRT